MSEDKLTEAFSESIKGDFLSCLGEYAEIGLDSILDDGLLKDVPLISTVTSIYKIGKSIRDRNYIKKLVIFLDAINRNVADDVEREKYENKFKENPNFRNKELEYILVIIDRYISYDKPAMIAKLYLAYLSDVLSWIEFSSYAEILDKLLPYDWDFFSSDLNYDSIFIKSLAMQDIFLRLCGIGLIRKKYKELPHNVDDDGIIDSVNPDWRETFVGYERTLFGQKLVDILK